MKYLTFHTPSITCVYSLIMFLSGCAPGPQIEGFDSSAWKQDKDGCQGVRLVLEESLWTNRVKLYDIQEAQIIELLGKPNRTNLYVRNQKIFVYYVGAQPIARQGPTHPVVCGLDLMP